MSVAAERSAILLGCYRKGEAADPEVYTRAVIGVLSKYPADIVRMVTDPLNGLPAEINWLPTIKEVHDACETRFASRRRMQERDRNIARQLAEREAQEQVEADRKSRPTLDEMKAKYGENWGLGSPDEAPRKKSNWRRYTVDELLAIYSPAE